MIVCGQPSKQPFALHDSGYDGLPGYACTSCYRAIMSKQAKSTIHYTIRGIPPEPRKK
jgi:hypothetical protein